MALEQVKYNIAAFDDSVAGGDNYIAGTIYEIFNTNDTLADIFSDAAGTNPIMQDGIENVSNNEGRCVFYIESGEYYIKVGAERDDLIVGVESKLINDISQDYEFDSVSSMINSSVVFPSKKTLRTTSYLGGWQATIKGPEGGAVYSRVTKAEHDIVRGTGTVDEKGDHTLLDGSVALLVDSNVTASMYGVVFNDLTDNKSSISAFISSQRSYFEWDEGVCRTSELIPIADGVEHHFNNTTLRTTGAGVQLLRANQTKDWSITGQLKLQGGGNGSELVTPTSEIMLNIVGARRYIIENVTCFETTGYGFKGVADGLLTERSEAGKMVNISSYRCQTGMEMLPGTTNEFVTITNINLSDNFIGLSGLAGNLSITSGAITDNAGGITMGFGTNSNHGIMTGVSVNHNSAWNLQATNVTNGFVFNACNWYGDGGDLGIIHLINSQGIVFNGGTLASRVRNDAGSATNTGRNKLNNMLIASTNAQLVGDDLSRLDSANHTALDSSVDISALLLTNGFTNATYANTWVTEAGRYDVGFYKDPQTAMVHLRGICKDGTGTIFTLPANHRPQAAQEFAINSNSAYGSILIQTDGQVVFINGDTAKVSLDGISISTS